MFDLLQRGNDDTFRLIERELRIGCWSWDLRSDEMKWSRGFYDLLGVEPDKVTPSFATILQVTHPEDRRSQAELEHIIREASSIRRKFRVIRPGGKVAWICCQIIVLVNIEGASEKALAFCRDVTLVEDQLKPLRIADERYKALIKATGGIVWIAKSDGRVHEVLNMQSVVNGAEAEIPDATGWADLVHPDDRERTMTAWKCAVTQKRTFEVVHRIRHPDGTYTWRRSQGEPILDDKGNVKEWLGLNVDVEQRTANASRPQLNRITGAQIRAARGLLKWSVMDLAEQSGVSRATIRRLEEIDGPPPQQARALMLIESALSRAGIDLLFPEVGKPGIRPR